MTTPSPALIEQYLTAAHEIHDTVRFSPSMDALEKMEWIAERIATAVSAAVTAERERCAGIATAQAEADREEMKTGTYSKDLCTMAILTSKAIARMILAPDLAAEGKGG